MSPTPPPWNWKGADYVVASLGVDSGYVPYTAYCAQASYIEENWEIIQKFTNAIQRWMEYVNTHTPEEIAVVIQPQFPETEESTIATIVARYQEQDTWKNDLIFEESSFQLLQDILDEAGELTARAPYEELVTTEFAEKASQQDTTQRLPLRPPGKYRTIQAERRLWKRPVKRWKGRVGMRIQNGRVYGPDGRFQVRDLCLDPASGRFSEESRDGQVWDASGCYLIPGLTDLHFHGCAGADFCDAIPEALERMAVFEASRGVTNICPASMTLPEERLTAVYRNAAAYRKRRAAREQAGRRCRGGAQLVGIYMEGPFFSSQKAGSQNPAWMQNPDAAMVRRLQKAAGGLLRQVAVAPELPGSLAFIEELKTEFRISLGHSNATYEQAMAAFAAGATQVTHLYNAMSPMTHRAPGLVGAALDREDGWVELIGDGIHVMAPMIRNTFRMFGKDRILLISDSLRAAGMPDGVYELGGQRIQKQGSRAVLAGSDTLAGSVSTLLDCLRFVVQEAEIPLEAAVQCAAVNPVRSLGLEAELGSLTPGKRARLVCLDEQLNLRAVWLEDGWVPLEETKFS